jgi:hypothetical protein
MKKIEKMSFSSQLLLILAGIVAIWMFALLSNEPMIKFFGSFWGTILTIMLAHVFRLRMIKRKV